MSGLSRWAEDDEASDLALWASRQQLLARERRRYHDRLAWKWLFGAIVCFAAIALPWLRVETVGFIGAVVCGFIAFANWNEARAASLAADTWPTDY